MKYSSKAIFSNVYWNEGLFDFASSLKKGAVVEKAAKTPIRKMDVMDYIGWCHAQA